MRAPYLTTGVLLVLACLLIGGGIALLCWERKELRAQSKRDRFVLDQMDGDAEEDAHEIKELRADMAWILNLCTTENPEEFHHTLHVDIKTVAEKWATPQVQGHELCRNGCCCIHCDTPTDDLKTTPCPRRLVGETPAP